MLRITITILLSVSTVVSLLGQTLQDTLLNLEYAIYSTSDAIAKNDLLLQKLEVYLKAERWDEEALNCASRIDRQLINGDSAKANFALQKSVLGHLNGKVNMAWNEFTRYKKYVPQLSEGERLYELQLAYTYGASNADSLLNNLLAEHPDWGDLDCIKEVFEFELRQKKALVIASYVLPGSGLIMNGNVFRGFTAMGLNAGIGYGIYWMINQKMPINAFVWGLGLIPKSYLGNVRLTKNKIEESELLKRKKLATECELFWINIQEKSPLILLK